MMIPSIQVYSILANSFETQNRSNGTSYKCNRKEWRLTFIYLKLVNCESFRALGWMAGTCDFFRFTEDITISTLTSNDITSIVSI